MPGETFPGLREGDNMSEHSSNHSGNHHRHHHKHRIKISKNAIIIALAVMLSVALFVIVLRQIDKPEGESPEQYEIIEMAESPETIGTVSADSFELDNKNTAKSTAVRKAVNWCAMGDSIAYGYYSAFGPDGDVTVSIDSRESVAWPFLVAEKKNWNLTNIALGGEGYLIQTEEGNGTCGYLQARSTDYTAYNLVTISLGINDWISNVPMGSMEDDPAAEKITAFIPAMRATIEAIAASNPICKIIVVLPLNINGPDHSLGTKDTNWAMGYEMSNTGTLKQFSRKMAEVCELYGLQYIDMSSQSCINSIGLPAMLPDGVHPAAETHQLLAAELAEKITFK